MTHYKNSLLNNSGEGHIDTGIKIIIGIVIGALILGGLYALFDTLVLPKLNTKVQGMMQYGENSPSYRYGATLSSLQYSYDGSTWMNAGGLFVFIPQMALALIPPHKTLGGADIKLSTALAFLLGAWKGIVAYMVGLILAVVIISIYHRKKNSNTKQPFALVPFLSIGAMILFFV